MPCTSFAVVDVRTGKIFWPSFFGVGECGSLAPFRPQLLSFKLESRLLIVRGSLELTDLKTHTFSDGPCGTFYYVMDPNGLKLIRSVLDEKKKNR